VCEREAEYMEAFDGNPRVTRPLGRPRRRWEDCIKMGLKETGVVAVDWIELAQVRDL
jgi:hypothetical protein